MIQEKPQSSELRTKISRTRKLAYVPEFKNELSLRPNVFRRFLRLSAGLNKNETIRDGNLTITLINIRSDAKYYKVGLDDEAFL